MIFKPVNFCVKAILLAVFAIAQNAQAVEPYPVDKTTNDKTAQSDYPFDKTLNSLPSIAPNSPTIDPVINYLPDVSSSYDAGSNPNVAIDDLRERIINGYAMPELSSPYTANHESWYASRPDYVRRMIDRSQRYLFHIVEEVEKRGMPTEIALLPMVESAFNPQANSRSQASGIWQFIPSTGKHFGLKQNWWVDNRRDVTAATDAALNYLQKLHVMFGTWDLALAAYNAGEGTVKRAIESNQRRGLPTDYVSLPLPPETRNYVPKLQALKNIMTHPERYGLSIQPIANRPYFTKVTAPEQIDAKLAAQLAEITFEEFSSLNPEYNRPVLTASGNVHEILLPVGAAETFSTNLANYDKPLVSWQTYHARRGERMDNIARKFGINVAQLRDVNDLPSRNKIGTARPLLVPNGGNSNSTDETPLNTNEQIPPQDSAQDSSDNGPSTVFHTVKKKETLASIAKRYGVSSKKIIAQNKLKHGHIALGQRLSIPMEAKPTKLASKADKKLSKNESKGQRKTILAKHGTSQKVRYVVKHGDTLDSIARRFDIARKDLVRWNKISDKQVVPGNKLSLVIAKDA
jgi:membrane-bound lytic murein transglycosylase D